MEQFVNPERARAEEPLGGTGLGVRASGGKRAAAAGKGVRFSTLILAVLAAAGLCLSAFLGLELEHTRMLLLRQSAQAGPPAPAEPAPPQEPVPPVGGEEPPAAQPEPEHPAVVEHFDGSVPPEHVYFSYVPEQHLIEAFNLQVK